MTITFEALAAEHGDAKAREIWAKACEIGGFGRVAPEHSGGLDIAGLPAETKKAIQSLTSTSKKEGK